MANEDDSVLMYRIRSIDRVLGENEELARQSIFFASPDRLNDPMEGFIDLVWDGDRAAWKNLLRLYTICLESTITFSILGGKPESYDLQLPVFANQDYYLTHDHKAICDMVYDVFMKAPVVNKFLDYICLHRGEIKRDELLHHLEMLHFGALDALFDAYVHYAIREKNEFKELSKNSAKKYLEALENYLALTESLDEKEKHDFSLLFEGIMQIEQSMYLINLSKAMCSQEPDAKRNLFLFLKYPKVFLQYVENILFPKWYTACFSSISDNPSIWAHYGNGHRGICFVFRLPIKNGNPYIRLYSRASGKHIPKEIELEFKPVNYKTEFETIDFFKSIGRISIRDLAENWQTCQDGEVSSCFDHIFAEEKWRRSYWDRFDALTTNKFQDWEYEREKRLILYSHLHDYSNEKNRTLEYDLKNLDGIIFGVKTNDEDKVKVINLIQQKCIECKRNKFNFYQAYFEKGKVSRYLLPFIGDFTSQINDS